MLGNIYEWCQNWYDSSYCSSPSVDPTGPTTGASRVIRGGGCNDYARICRSASRYYYHPDLSYITIGFRLVLSSGRQ